jgi:hypothetical protein
MRQRVVVLLLWVVLSVACIAGGVHPGMTRSQAEAALGKPVSVLKKGDRTVLLYPSGGYLEFADGRLDVFRGVPVETAEEAAAATAAREAEARAREEAVQQERREGELAAQADAAAMAADQAARAQIEAAVERLSENPQATVSPFVESPSHFWMSLGIGAVFRLLISVVVLKLAFNWADVHADWSQMFLPAFADMASKAGIEGGVYALWGATELFHLDYAASYFVLLGTLMKTTHACTLARAVSVAVAAKVFSAVAWSFASVALLQLTMG